MKPAVQPPTTAHQLSQPFRLLYRIWYYMIVLPTSFLIVTPFLGLMTYVFAFFSARWAVYMGVLWARYILWVSLIRAKVFGVENIEPGQSYVVVVNHESNLDIIGIYGHLPIDFRWVMKIEIRKFPILPGSTVFIPAIRWLASKTMVDPGHYKHIPTGESDRFAGCPDLPLVLLGT